MVCLNIAIVMEYILEISQNCHSWWIIKVRNAGPLTARYQIVLTDGSKRFCPYIEDFHQRYGNSLAFRCDD